MKFENSFHNVFFFFPCQKTIRKLAKKSDEQCIKYVMRKQPKTESGISRNRYKQKVIW